MTDADDKTPLEQAVDLTVYAPIGFVLEARRLLPSFVERGRQQVTMAKMVGQFAVTHGQTTAAKQLTKVQAQAEQLLGELGLAPLAASPAPVDAAPVAEAPTAAPEATPTPRAGAGAEELPIAGYDSLAASQVIPRLEGLAPAELAAVEAYEAAHRGRKTILGKVAQLRAE